MVIGNEKLKSLRVERPKYVERFDQRAFKSKYQSDLIKGVVEIIKNSVDAYINEKGDNNCNQEEIRIILENLNTKNPVVKIVNFAESMDSKKFEIALGVGADTSSDVESVTGAHGYGMKEAAWAFKQAKIVAINKNKYSTRIFLWDEKDTPKYAWDIEDGKEVKDIRANETIRKETGIKDDGTYFEAVVPDDISFPRPENLRAQLANNILLRTINQSDKFKITIEFKDTKSEEYFSMQVKYTPPEPIVIREDRKALEIGNFSFEYPLYDIINCSYEIYLANRELPPTGDSREAGLLICAGPFSVLDCTLFDHSGNVANRFFGKVTLSGSIRQICKNERILDERREAGLLRKTPLYESLYKHFNPLLEKLIEMQRKRLNKKILDVREGIIEDKIELLKAFNKIAREEVEPDVIVGPEPKFEPGPSGMRFCIQEYLKLIERQEKKVHIVINPEIIPEGSEIELITNKDGLKIYPTIFEVTREEIDKGNIFKKKISFSSDVVDSFLVEAHVKDMLYKTEMNVDTIKDQRLHINEPLEFVPPNDDIVAGKSKDFSLIIDFSRVAKEAKFKLEIDQLFTFRRHVKVKEAKQIADSVYELIIPVHCIGKPKQKGQILATLGEAKAILKLEIIDPRDRNLKGDFEGIKDDPMEDPQEIGYYENKIICIYIHHPIFRHYRRNKEGENNPIYIGLYCDVIIREFCKVLARKKAKIFENTSAEEYRVKFNDKYEELYKKHSVRLHKFCINEENLEKLRID